MPLVAFEGLPGTGKTTVAIKLTSTLGKASYVKITKYIPKAILTKFRGKERSPYEKLVFYIEWFKRLCRHLRKELNKSNGKLFIADRWYYTIVVYYSYHASLTVDDFLKLVRYYEEDGDLLEPDLIFLFTISYEEYVSRLKARGNYKEYEITYDFYRRCSTYYEALGSLRQVDVIDVTGRRVEDVTGDVIRRLSSLRGN